MLQSEDFSTTWYNYNSSESVNAAIAPDGTLTADKLIVDVGVTYGLLRQNFGLPDNIPFCLSVYAKAAEFGNMILSFYNNANTFCGTGVDLTNGTFTSGPFNATRSIESVGNGWYRIAIFFSSGSGTNTPNIRIVCSNTGDGTSGIYLWGAQLEQSSYPTSYIPTTTSTATRAADVSTSATASVFESDWYRQDEGTVFSDLKLRTLGTSGFPRMIAFVQADPNSANQFAINTRNLGSVDDGRFYAAVGDGTVFGDFVPPPGSPAFSAKLALSVKQNDGAFTVAGYPVVSDNTLNMPSPVELRLFGQARFQSNISGWMKRLTYYPQRLPDATLQALTL